MPSSIEIQSAPDSETAAPQASTLVELLRLRARRQPEQTAYTFLADGEREELSLTYAQLERRARSVAAYLQHTGARGERVMLLYPPGLDFVAGFFGCLFAGAVAVPAYPPRANQNLLRLQTIVEDTRPVAVLTNSSVLPKVDAFCERVPGLKTLRWLATDEADDRHAELWRAPSLTPDSLAFLQYTSGSTSAPKGVMVTHGNLLANERVIQHAFRQTEESVIVGWLPFYHDMGLIGNVLQPLYLGARCVLMSPLAFLQKPLRWLEAVSRYRATTSGGPNFAYELCARKVTAEQRAALDLSSWEVAFNGAEPIRADTLEMFAEAFAECGFRREAFHPCYGLAEATLIVSGTKLAREHTVKELRASALEQNRAEEADESAGGNLRRVVGSGAVVPGHRVVVVRPETAEECAAGEVGEVWVAGPSVARGYWNRPEETERTFRAALSDADGGAFLRTGDLGFLRGGELFVTGRLKDLVIVRGVNHYPQDIELTAERSHEILRPGCGAAFSIEEGGEERLVVVQEIDLKRRHEAERAVERIRAAVAEGHEVEPFAVALVRPGGVPKTSSGKIQRALCRAKFLAGELEIVSEWRAPAVAVDNLVAPTPPAEMLQTASQIEAWLVAQLASRLGVEAAEIDVNRPVTRYGLDSLTAIELMHGIEVALGVTLPMVSFLQSPSVAQLAAQALVQLASNASPVPPTVVNVAAETSAEHALSYGQRSLWFLHELAPDSPAYNITSAMRLRAALDIPALRRAFLTLVERHPSLRTTFAAPHGEPVQRVEERAEVCFAEVDASMWGEAELYSRLREQAHLPFDLERGPVFRVSLFARGAQEYILLVNVHHIVADFWSLAVLMHELGVLYAAEKTGNAAALAPVASHYSDYVCWQAGMLAGPAGERLWSYWQGQLAGELPVMNLPTDHPRPPVQTYRGSSHSFSLTEELTRALKELARAHDATLHTTLLAAFAALLHRHTGQTDLLVGTPTAGRNRAELAGVVGYFVNPVVLRADASQNPTFAEFLARVRSTTLSAFEHQDYPFAHLVERLQPARDPSRSPLVQVMFALQKAQLLNREGLAAFALGEDGSAITLGELEIESVRLEQRVSQFDLTLMMAEGEGALSGSLQYSTDLFDAGTIARLAGHFRTLLASVVADPEQRIAELPLLTEAETRQLLSDWNDNAADYPRDVCVHELFERRAALAPDALAAECARGALTYRDLDERANRVARVLRAHGVGAESIVGVLVNRSGEMLAALLGVLKAGGAYLPIDPAYPAERIAFMLRDSGAAVLLTEAELAAELPAHGARVVLLDAERESLARESCAPLAPAAKSENLAYVIYTSGSTGRPKGVAVTHRSLMNLVNWHRSAYNVTPEDRATQLAGTGFDASVWELWPYLTAGASIHLSDEETRLAPALLRDWLVERRATVTFLPTPLAESVLSLEWPQDAALKFMLTGGDRLTLYPTPAHAFQLVNHYGPTEYTVVTTAARVPARLEAESAPPIGRPVSNTRVYLLDARMQTVPVGVVGELYVGGDGLARGYLNRPELTAERFVPDPFSTEPGARLYRTGDLARFLADGQIEYVGRSDEQVKIRGFRIELGEIEAALAQHELLREVVVVARQEGGEKRLVAYVTTHEGAERTTASELRGFLKSRLPDYMIPSAFVVLDAMPLTPNGKVDRRELPAPESASAEGEGTHVAPRTPVEEVLAGIWAQVLGRTRVGATDNFFELGGHSLLATQVMSRVRESFQVELPLRALFEEPTVAGLAAVVESAARVEAGLEVAPPRVVSRDGELPLSFAQQRLWFLDQLEPGRAFYNIPAAVEMKGDLNVAALEQALNEVVRRHESLCTVFERVEGRPVPVVLGEQTLALPLTDLRHLSECDREVETLRLMTEEAQRPFDLAKGPLVRAGLARVADDGHVLLITMHHVASDGWSMDVLVREVGALYEAFSEGRPSPLAELPIQYADFAAWQRERLQGEFLEKQLAYWREQLAGAPAALELPTDRPRPAVQSFLGATETLELDFELGERLKSLSRQEGATLFMTLLAGFQVLLARYTNQTDIVVGTPVANRNHVELESLIGFFVNTVVLRADVSDDPTFAELLARVREVSLGAYTHQELPFEKLVEELHPERDLSRTPLFQVMFALQKSASDALELPGLRLNLLKAEAGAAKFDLTLTVEDGARGLRAALEYNTDLFDAATAARMLGHLRNILEAATDAPDTRVSELPLLNDAERRQVLVEWNDTARGYAADACVHELFEQQAAAKPDAVALVADGEQVTYGELNARANRLARYLLARGAGVEQRVAVMMSRSAELVAALLAVLKSGAAYVPVDPNYPRERIAYMLEDAGASVLLTEEKLGEQVAARGSRVVRVDAEAEGIAREDTSNLGAGAGAGAGNLAYVIYTSGSTGKPKGVALEHRSAVTMTRWAREVYTDEELSGVLFSTSVCFDISIFELFVTLAWGGRIILAENALQLPTLPEGTEIKLINTVPSAMAELVRLGLVPSTVRTVNLAGEPISRKLAREVYRIPTVEKLYDLYGPTEDTVYSTFELLERDADGSPLIGRSLADSQAYVLDARMQPVPAGVTGELYLGGDGLARGYLNRPDLTADKFIPDPFSAAPGARMYKTGDLARRLADGRIDFLGRIDNQVKIRGFRIELGEIETALGQCPRVREALVMAREDGGGDKRLVAYVVGSDSPKSPASNTPVAELSASELRGFLKSRLPDYMIPSVFVVLDAMPLTPNGKVDRKQLPAPDGSRAANAPEYVEPRGATEAAVAAIWSEVLGIERVGAADNFFDLGGHSLLATRVLAKLCAAFNVEIPLRAVFESPTVAELARTVERAAADTQATRAPEIVAYSRERFRRPSPVAAEALRGQQV